MEGLGTFCDANGSHHDVIDEINSIDNVHVFIFKKTVSLSYLNDAKNKSDPGTI